MFTFLAPVVGTIARLPRAAVALGAAYTAGMVVSGTKSIINGDTAKEVAVRTVKSWWGMERTAPMKKRSEKSASKIKKAADRVVKNPTKKNVQAALATAKEEGVKIPDAVVLAVETL